MKGRRRTGKFPLCGSTQRKIRPDFNEWNLELTCAAILFHQTGSEQGLRVLVDTFDVAAE